MVVSLAGEKASDVECALAGEVLGFVELELIGDDDLEGRTCSSVDAESD